MRWFGTGVVSASTGHRPNLRLLLSRFELVGKEHSPCGSRSRATSIAAQQNR